MRKTLALLITLLASAALAAEPPPPADQASAMASTRSALGQWQTEDGFRANLAAPITSAGTPMRTLDGRTSFDAAVVPASSARLLDVLALPLPTGDVRLRLGQDLDLDGQQDSAWDSPPISGVCANGAISCTPGTWSNCKYLLWQAAADGRLDLAPAATTDLGGCYCINNTCGNTLAMGNLASVLGDLGGGATMAIMAAKPSYSISAVGQDGALLTYYGVDTAPRPAAGTTAPNTAAGTLAAYAGNAGALEAAGRQAMVDQSGDPGSHYSLLTSVAQRTASSIDSRTCSVKRTMALASLRQLCGEPPPTLPVIGSHTERRFYTLRPGWTPYLYAGRGGGPTEAALEQIYAGTYNGWYTKDTGHHVAAFSAWFLERKTVADEIFSGQAGPIEALAAPPEESFPVGSVVLFSHGEGNHSDSDNMWSRQDWYELCHSRYDLIDEAVADTCAPYAQDRQCTLREEEVDGVQTWRSSQPTGLSPLASARQFTGELAIYPVERPWWERKRTYWCEREQAFDLAGAAERGAAIIASTDRVGSELHYADLQRSADGSLSGPARALALPELETGAPCERACKTRAPRRGSDVGFTGPADSLRSAPAQWDFFYRVCSHDDACPLEQPGEEIVKDCQCLNEFADAAGALLILNHAADLTCTSGQRKPAPAMPLN